jgi:hydroxymethylbilane synthase
MKGLFVAEIVRALQDEAIDIAVHSAKDLPAGNPEGVVIAAVPRRAPAVDVLVTRDREPAPGATIGTSSLRRRGQLLRARPDLQPVEVRGNVDTRLQKMSEAKVDGLVLAAAGLIRLGLEPRNQRSFTLEEMIPAPGQGALAVQARPAGAAAGALADIDHGPSHVALDAERELMSLLGGGCDLPFGAHARVENEQVHLIGIVLAPDGSEAVRAEARAADPLQAAEAVAVKLRAGGADRILEAIR